MTAYQKLLVIAGTHRRENEFSYEVADRVVRHYSKSGEAPKLSGFVGIDGARRAQVFEFDQAPNVAVAKIYVLDRQSPAFIRGQSLENLFESARFRVQNINSGTEPAERFGNVSHRTSVHGQVLNYISPSFIFDLHSYHKYTDGISGTAATICAQGTPQGNAFVASALAKAKAFAPQVYGANDGEQCPEKHKRATIDRIISLKKAAIIEQRFSADELREVLLAQNKKDPAISKFAKKLKNLDTEFEREFYANWGNKWFLFNNANPQAKINYSCFEGVHWGPEQQDATAKFITDFLVPELQLK